MGGFSCPCTIHDAKPPRGACFIMESIILISGLTNISGGGHGTPGRRAHEAALAPRVPVAQYRAQFETERAAQFAPRLRADRRAKRDGFVSLHQLEGCVQQGLAIQLTGEGTRDVIVMASLYFEVPIPAFNTWTVRVEVNCRTRTCVMHEGRDHEEATGPGWYEWVYPFDKAGDPATRSGSMACSAHDWREAYIAAIEECVVVLAEHYSIPATHFKFDTTGLDGRSTTWKIKNISVGLFG